MVVLGVLPRSSGAVRRWALDPGSVEERVLDLVFSLFDLLLDIVVHSASTRNARKRLRECRGRGSLNVIISLSDLSRIILDRSRGLDS